MRISQKLMGYFSGPFEKEASEFLFHQGLLPAVDSLSSPRFLRRSVAPHVQKLSDCFNRVEGFPEEALERYWKSSSNPRNRLLSYFLFYLPPHACETAVVLEELVRWGYRFPFPELRAIDFGSGVGSAPFGVSLGAGLSGEALKGMQQGSWELWDHQLSALRLAQGWLSRQGDSRWKIHLQPGVIRGFDRTTKSGKFNLCVMSYFLNELSFTPEQLAKQLGDWIQSNLEPEGLVIILEPGSRLQNRKLLQLRQELIHWSDTQEGAHPKRLQPTLKVLTPCFGHQHCGALQKPSDWCHETVPWWRPAYFRQLDEICGMDHKSLPFSYLALTYSSKTRDEIFPALQTNSSVHRYRLLSDVHRQSGRNEIFICGESGKQRILFQKRDKQNLLQRGDVLLRSTEEKAQWIPLLKT